MSNDPNPTPGRGQVRALPARGRRKWASARPPDSQPPEMFVGSGQPPVGGYGRFSCFARPCCGCRRRPSAPAPRIGRVAPGWNSP